MASDSANDLTSTDSWHLWSTVYSDRDMRMKLYCRDPDERTPFTSNTLVVRNVHLDCSPKSIVEMFAKFGSIESSGFPAVMRHYQSRYCFIKFQEIRDAVRACNFYHGFKLRGRVLEVVHYDSAYKYSKLVERSKNVQLKNSSEENIVGYVRQAHLQAEYRTTKFRPKLNATVANCSFQKTLSTVQEEKLIAAGASDFGKKGAKASVSSANIGGDATTFVNTTNIETLLTDPEEEENDEEENRIKKNVKCVDDVGLETEESFWNWLDGKLNFAGPLHHAHADIARALHKLPQTVRRQLEWFVGSLRANDRLKMIGPFICLPEHAYWAKEMCVINSMDTKCKFKEIWEPLHPSDIKNEKHILKYIRAMVIHFGPLSITDNKILILLRSLPEPLKGNPAYSPDGLCRIVENSSLFVVDKDIYYLVREHDHLLGRIRVKEWCMEEAFSNDVEECKDSGCGTSINSSDAAI